MRAGEVGAIEVAAGDRVEAGRRCGRRGGGGSSCCEGLEKKGVKRRRFLKKW